MLYKAAGRNISVSEKSSFGDTDTLSDEEIQCIEDAYKNGFIRGERTTTGLYIKPDEPVSRAEAAVLTAKIAGIEIPVSLANQTFTDESAIQTDMIDSVRAVCSIGICLLYTSSFRRVCLVYKRCRLKRGHLVRDKEKSLERELAPGPAWSE